MYPALTYRDVPAALEWLRTAFGIDSYLIDPGDPNEPAVLTTGETVALVQRDRPEELHGSHVGRAWLYVRIEDADAHHRRAQAAGAAVQNKPHDYGAGDRGYSARDLEGNLWSFGTHQVPPVACAPAEEHPNRPSIPKAGH
jgi:uncharacterized glyoxalase superfamily protein PhnB